MHDRIETWILSFLRKGGETGRELAFNRIWRSYHGRIRFFIRNRVPADAEDLTQEIMLKVYQSLDRFDPERSFNAWMYSIARNHSMDGRQTGPIPRHSIKGKPMVVYFSSWGILKWRFGRIGRIIQ